MTCYGHSKAAFEIKRKEKQTRKEKQQLLVEAHRAGGHPAAQQCHTDPCLFMKMHAVLQPGVVQAVPQEAITCPTKRGSSRPNKMHRSQELEKSCIL